MKARRLHIEAKRTQFRLVPHPPDKARPVVADHSVPSSRDSSAQRPEPNRPIKSVNPSPPSHPRQLRPEELISQYASPQFVGQRGRKWNLANGQPRQKQPRANTVEPTPTDRPKPPETEVSVLSNLASEMKRMFELMPQMSVPRDRRKMSRSVQYENQPDLSNTQHRNRIVKQRLSSHNVHAGAAAVYQQHQSYETPTALSSQRSQYRRSRKGDSRRPSRAAASARAAGELPSLEKPQAIESLQRYFLDFHKKSRELLGKLERSVLG